MTFRSLLQHSLCDCFRSCNKLLLQCVSGCSTSFLPEAAPAGTASGCHVGAQAGFRTLLEDGNVLQCWSDRLDAIYHAELGASAAILRAGYNVDCLLQRYQGYDWRDRRHWGCNNNRSPVGEGLFGGSTLSLHDLMFVKVKTLLLADGDSTAMLAVKYSGWKSFDKNISSNIWYDARLEGRA